MQDKKPLATDRVIAKKQCIMDSFISDIAKKSQRVRDMTDALDRFTGALSGYQDRDDNFNENESPESAISQVWHSLSILDNCLANLGNQIQRLEEVGLV